MDTDCGSLHLSTISSSHSLHHPYRILSSLTQGMDTDNCGSLGLSSILSTLQVSLPPDEVRSAVAEALMEAGVVDHVDWYEKPTVDESIRAGRAFAKGGR